MFVKSTFHNVKVNVGNFNELLTAILHFESTILNGQF